MKTNELPPHAQLMKFIVGRWISKPIYVAARLGIADLLENGPESIETLAIACNAHAPTLYRVMRALASVGIFLESQPGRFELTPMAQCLKTGTMRSMAVMFNSEWSDAAWGCFPHGVKTGDTPFEKAYGMPLMSWLEENKEAAQVFNQANAVKAAGSHSAVVDAYDFADIGLLMDVGGGTGALTAEILKANLTMKAIVADTASVIQETKEMIKKLGLEERCRAVECNFFQSIPKGPNAYLFSNILHDWTDDQCRIILSNCKKAMKKDARLLVVEMVVPYGNQPCVSKLLDLEMFDC